MNVCNQVKCSSKSLHFQLSADIKAKWNDALKQRIPLFFNQPKESHEDDFDEAMNLFILFNYKVDRLF
uniref:THAP-type domain-containing protein n=1 Tax=Meloidogyne javanica TaxID=6303 RepID=A0A915LRN0_MELJA